MSEHAALGRREEPAAKPARSHSRAKPRRGGRVTEKRHKEIVEQAAKLFLDRGYANVTIDDIVAQIGGSKRTLYARFGGKAGLFEIVIKDYCAGVTHNLEAGVDPRAPVEQQLTGIGTNFLRMILDPKILEQHRLMVSMGRSFPSVTQVFFKAGPLIAYGIVANWARRQQAAGRLAPADPDQLAALFLDMLTGKHQLALLTSSPGATPQAIAETVKAAAALFLRGAAKA